MGLATLNVWVHDNQDTCKISDNTWFVTATYCNGEVVEWCGHEFIAEPANCGHAEFRLPPGCYVVRAFRAVIVGRFIYFSFTEHAIVIVGCDELACVHLFAPTDRQSVGWPGSPVRFLAESQNLPADEVDNFEAAKEALLKALPETAADRASEKLVRQLAEFLKNAPPEGSAEKG